MEPTIAHISVAGGLIELSLEVDKMLLDEPHPVPMSASDWKSIVGNRLIVRGIIVGVNEYGAN